MSEQFVLPDVGEGLTEAEIVEWKVAVGDTVTLNQPLVDIETAKAQVELPSPYAGVVTVLHANVGDVVEVGRPLIEIDTGGGAATPSTPVAATAAAAEPEAPAGRTAVLVGYGVAGEDTTPARRHRRGGATAPAPTRPPVSPPPSPTAAPPSGRAPRSTPPVRLYAKQHGVDIGTLPGSGPEGLITRADVDAALGGTTRSNKVPTGGGVTRFVGHDLAPWDSGPREERIAIRGVLRSMVESMTKSAFTQPQASAWLRVDATKTVELLASLKGRPSLGGARVSPLTITALAFCDAARNFPGINSTLDDTTNEVVVKRSVNMGIAADTPRGLIVPNIKEADRLDLVGMATAITSLVERARAGTSTPAEMIGTTLTITNVGPFGVDGAMAILPPTTSAILALGQLVRAPWVEGDSVVVRHVVEITLTFDHRIIDGALASQVLAHIGAFLRDPAPALIAG